MLASRRNDFLLPLCVVRKEGNIPAIYTNYFQQTWRNIYKYKLEMYDFRNFGVRELHQRKPQTVYSKQI